ncbi:MAG: response regulator, partial [Acutalibacter sp.]|nr:response regulator [Acutalibacter sp.]
MKLLVCDDDISTIDVIQSQLNCQELGIQCILRAYNGEAAIGIIERERPELILCDIGMPKVSGIEVLKYI